MSHSCASMDVTCQAPLFMGVFWQEYWSGLPFPSPGDLPGAGIEPTVLTSSASEGRLFTTVPPGNKASLLCNKWFSLQGKSIFRQFCVRLHPTPICVRGVESLWTKSLTFQPLFFHWILVRFSGHYCSMCHTNFNYGGSDGKESACNAGHSGLIPGSGRSPGEGNGYSLQ